MHKWFLIAAAVFFIGDPNLTLLEFFGENRDYAVALAIALIANPWIVAHIDN